MRHAFTADTKMMMNRLVPFAVWASMPSTKNRNAGTMKMPPPRPSAALIIPTAQPSSSISITNQTASTSSP